MGKIAFVFSGQGAQYSGMGKELFEESPAAKAVFTLADSIRPNTSAQCFEGSKEELGLTINTQPVSYTHLTGRSVKPTGIGGIFARSAGRTRRSSARKSACRNRRRISNKRVVFIRRHPPISQPAYSRNSPPLGSLWGRTLPQPRQPSPARLY